MMCMALTGMRLGIRAPKNAAGAFTFVKQVGEHYNTSSCNLPKIGIQFLSQPVFWLGAISPARLPLQWHPSAQFSSQRRVRAGFPPTSLFSLVLRQGHSKIFRCVFSLGLLPFSAKANSRIEELKKQRPVFFMRRAGAIFIIRESV